MTVLEAFAAAAPVVATSLGGLPELIEPQRDGLLVPPDDVPALAGALASLLGDPAVAERMGAAARAKALTRFHPDIHLAGLDRLYAEAGEWVRRQAAGATHVAGAQRNLGEGAARARLGDVTYAD